MLFGCPEGAKNTIFRGPHVRLIFDRQTTDFLLKNYPQNGLKIDLFLEPFLRCHLGPLLGHFGSQNGTKKGPKNDAFLRGPTLLKYCK